MLYKFLSSLREREGRIEGRRRWRRRPEENDKERGGVRWRKWGEGEVGERQ